MRLTLPAAEDLLLPFTSGQIATCLPCGFVVGLERQLRSKPIGIRTSTLIVLGSYCFLAMLGAVTADAAERARVLGQLITGVGFLGAGVMMTRDGIVTGATSAATVWMMAAAGAMIGLDLDRQAIIMTVLVVITSHYAYMFDNRTLITFPREYLTGGIGRLGVSIFFMISGALAYVSLTRYSLREYYVRRTCSVLIPYNMVYFTAALILLVLGLYFRYLRNPLEQLMNGEKNVIAFLPTLVGIDHYLHGIWGMETAYLTGEWFIGCIILHYAIAPLVFRIMQLAPLLTMSATLAVSIVCYDRTFVNPYWSAQVWISDFAFGMLFMHFLPWFCKWRRLLAVMGLAVITCGCVMADLSLKTIREVLFPLAPRSLIFSVAFLFILHASYPVINPLLTRHRVKSNVSGLASRAYIIMLLQHVVANINMAELNAAQATLFWVLALVTTERISAALKTGVSKAEKFTVKHILKKC